MTDFATELRRQLDAAGLSQNALARRSGLTPGMISRMLHDIRTPSRETVGSLAAALVPGDTAADAQRRHRLWLAAGLVPDGYEVTALERVEVG